MADAVTVKLWPCEPQVNPFGVNPLRVPPWLCMTITLSYPASWPDSTFFEKKHTPRVNTTTSAPVLALVGTSTRSETPLPLTSSSQPLPPQTVVPVNGLVSLIGTVQPN